MKNYSVEKAKPVAKQGRKATDLLSDRRVALIYDFDYSKLGELK